MAGLSFGGLEEIRTPDPHNANVVRSQLRYKPITTKDYNARKRGCQDFWKRKITVLFLKIGSNGIKSVV